MSDHHASAPYPKSPPKKVYKSELHDLQVELVKLQKHLISHADRILVLFEGRDSGGKDGTIKRIVQHLSPRETRVVALGKPSERDRTSWYFQRYAPPAGATAPGSSASWSSAPTPSTRSSWRPCRPSSRC